LGGRPSDAGILDLSRTSAVRRSLILDERRAKFPRKSGWLQLLTDSPGFPVDNFRKQSRNKLLAAATKSTFRVDSRGSTIQLFVNRNRINASKVVNTPY